MIEFEGLTDEQVQEWLKEHGMVMSQKQEDRSWIGLYPLIFTLSVCMGQYTTYMYRWCFEDKGGALLFFLTAKVLMRCRSKERHSYRNHPLLIEKDENGYDKW